MKIVINPFDEKSIDNAIKKVETYKKDFKRKEQEFVKELAEIGVIVAKSLYSTAQYDGVNDVKNVAPVVTLTPTGAHTAVVFEGETIGFIEFGTGVFNPAYNSAGLMYTPPPHGSYGKGKGKQKSWGYYGEPGTNGVKPKNRSGVVITEGNPPAEAMLSARNKMINEVILVARRVWR